MQGMALAHGEKYLICAHQQGYVTVIDLEDFSVQILQPFGDIENIWDVMVIRNEFMPLIERLVFATSNGCYTATFSQDGVLEYECVFFEKSSVSNCDKVKDDLIIVTLNDEEGLSRIETIDTGSNET